MPVPNIIDVIRMYRSECGMSFFAATERAIREFDERGWIVPESIRSITQRRNPR